MSDTLIATLGGLWAMMLWGAGDWLLSRSSKKSDVYETNLAFQLPSVFIAGALVLATRHHVNSFHNIWILCIASVIFALAFVLFIRALSIGAAGLVVPASSIYPLITLVLSAIILSVHFGAQQTAGMVVVVFGVVLLAFEKRNKKISLHKQHMATLLAVLTAFLWGAGNVFQNSVIGKEAWQNVVLAIDVPITVVGILLILGRSRSNSHHSFANVLRSRRSILSGITYSLGSLGFYYSAVRVGSVIIPIVVSSLGPLVTSALSAIYDGERLTFLKRAGAVIAIAGIILINTG